MPKGRIGNGAVVTHGFLLGIEFVDGPINIEAIMTNLVDGAMVAKNVDGVDIEYLGELDLVKDEEVFDSTTGEPVKKGGIRES